MMCLNGAHERVLFEQVMERLTSGPLESQRLLTPMLIEMSPAQRHALIPHAATLEKFGLEIEEFGGDSVRLSAVPAVLDPSECEAAIRALASDLEGLDRGSRVEDALRRIAATMACHAAVKANDPLTPEKMRYILEELRRTAYSSVCPHGRPVVLRITRREIERNFQRICPAGLKSHRSMDGPSVMNGTLQKARGYRGDTMNRPVHDVDAAERQGPA